MATKRRNPYLSQAKLAAIVRYSPEEQAVAALLRQAQQNFSTNVSTARAVSEGTTANIDRARPGIQQIYTDAGLSAAPVAAPALPSGALDFASAGQFEQAAGQHRLSTARTAELQNLADQRLAAGAAGTYGVANARKQLQSDLANILDRNASLGKEKGAFIASTLLDLQDKAAGRSLTRRGQTLAHQDRVRGQDLSHSDRVAARNKTAADKKKFKWATPEQHAKLRDKIELGIAQARRLQTGGRGRAEIVQTLITGRPKATVTDPKTNEKITVPGIKAVPAAAARAAVEVVFDGGITPGTVKQLHRRKISIKRLGYQPVPFPKPPAPPTPAFGTGSPLQPITL